MCCRCWCQVLALGYSVGRVEELPAGTPCSGVSSSSRSKLLVRRLVKVYTPGMTVEGLGTVSRLGLYIAVAHARMHLPVAAYASAPNGGFMHARASLL
jgi:hypothetical protein